MIEEHKIIKSKLFISHASSDGDFANAVKQEIEKVFANGIEVFCTSSPGAIGVGVDWLSEIEKRLEGTQAVLVIVTPISIKRRGFGLKLVRLGIKVVLEDVVFTHFVPLKSTLEIYRLP